MKMPALAAGLGISLNHAYRCKRVGMPTDSVKNARAWRDANLDPCRRQGGRIDRPALSPAPSHDAGPLEELWDALLFEPLALPGAVARWLTLTGNDPAPPLVAALVAMLEHFIATVDALYAEEGD